MQKCPVLAIVSNCNLPEVIKCWMFGKFSRFFLPLSKSFLNAHLTCCIPKVPFLIITLVFLKFGMWCRVFFGFLSSVSCYWKGIEFRIENKCKSKKKRQRTKREQVKKCHHSSTSSGECHLKSQIECLFGRKCFRAVFFCWNGVSAVQQFLRSI